MAETALVAIVAVNLAFLVTGIGWLLSYWRHARTSAWALGLFLFAALALAGRTDSESEVSLAEAAIFAAVVFALLMLGIATSTRARVSAQTE